MRKYAFFALILLIASFIGGCGSSDGTSSTVIVTTNMSFAAASDVSGKTVYILPAYTGLTKKYKAYQFSGTTNSVTYDSALNLDTSPTLGNAGTWDITNDTLTIKDSNNNTLHTFKRIQTETNYWLAYDTNNGNRISRIYFDSVTNGVTTTAQKSASDYLASIYISTTNKFLMGGTVQGQQLSFTGAADTRTVSTLAGSKANTPGTFANTSSAGSERFSHPTGVTSDGTNLYVADTANHVIRKVVLANDTTSGTTTTIAGTPGVVGSADTTPTNTPVTFSSPQGITYDGTYLYVADTGNAVIRRIDLSTTPATVTTIAGLANTLGAVDSTTSGADARFYSPVGITTDGTNLYVTDTSYHTIRKIQTAKAAAGSQYSQSVTTLAGSPGSAGSVDGTGTAARFNVPNRITTDGTNLYVTDFNNHTIRKILIATGATSTIAGSPGVGASSSDGDGTSARFYYPSGITTDGTNLFITEFNDTNSSSPNYNNLIRQMNLVTTTVTTIAGGSKADLISVDSANGPARFSKPIDLTSNGTNLFVSNYSNGYTDPVTKIVYPNFNNIRMVGP
jgi:hypothetical protein